MHEMSDQESLRKESAAQLDEAQIYEHRVGLVLRELAHEFGNLIFPLQMVMELQERSGKLTVAELNEILRSHIGELTTITRRFQRIGRCFSGKLEMEIEPVSPSRIVQAAADEARAALNACGHSLHCEASAAPATVEADLDLMQQALCELLDNAVRFTPSGGRIEMIAHQQNGDVEFLVRDNGRGIAPELQPVVFEPFVYGGTKLDIGAGRFGCGLTLVDRIARSHGGHAELRQSSSAGSEFAICIPVTRPA
jgi:signal transduction histidine kinase